MKKNLILAASFAVAIFATSCDNNAGSDNVTETEATATEATTTAPVVENPNVAGAEGAEASENAAAITFAETSYDFGTVKQGEVIEHTFKFTNTGKSPLIIESATATCGCTVPKSPDKPIAPGETGEIQVNFNSTGKVGMQSPVITVRANTVPNITQVTLKGTVEANNIPTAGADGPVKRN
ncbi:putative cupredoxin-like copper-binding protein [Pontibacter aydingkolensis]|uniref:DUF1573 domain-containing protein n=1 Tax=Pontibacter aydingkolensis TaxID=1911536 RepID=A0ABS7CQN6_9BACT|nr:DUF1573 domain-containing protein [Pontibacter aydingkolensis]MBW7466161.1 DUF1573 domain-containing protein [Pontibacter aydingkolensis]